MNLRKYVKKRSALICFVQSLTNSFFATCFNTNTMKQNGCFHYMQSTPNRAHKNEGPKNTYSAPLLVSCTSHNLV